MTPNRHFNNTLSRVALDHVGASAGGDAAVAEVLRRAGEERPLTVILDDQQWSSYDDFRRLLEAAATVLGGSKWLRDIAYVSVLGGGSAPDATVMLRSFGSPDGLMAMVGEANFGLCSVEQSVMEKVGRNEWLHRRRFEAGYAHFEEHCELSVAMTGIIPRLFGLPVVQLDKETCRLAGDEWCTTRIRWSDRPTAASEADELRTTVDLLEGRMATLQRSVAELVSPDELEVVLARVVRSAATAARAPGFLLALEPLPWSTQLVYSDGIDEERAAQVAAELRAGALAPSHVLAVASARRHHGHLVATEFPLVEGQRAMLESYARLAASVLDSAIALEEARRQAATATVLLELSATLDDLVTTEELAGKLAEAATIVTGADRSMVVLLDAASAHFRVAASHGYTPEDAGPLAEFSFPIEDDLPQDIRYVQPATSALSDILLPLGAVAMAAVPVLIDGAVVGWIGVDAMDEPARLAPSAELEGRLLGLAGQAATALRNAGLVEQIREQALHDALTGLPNRRMVLERLEHLAAGERHVELAVLFVDLDDFKDVNDSLGHGVGDDLLRAVADRLSSVVRATDMIGRLGGDEFVVITRGGDPDELARRLLAALERPFDVHGVSGRPIRVSASIGIASGASSSSDLLRDADVALYEAKRGGRNRSTRFLDSMQEALTQRLTLEDELREGIARGTFRLEYQPIVELGSGRPVAMEALLRWESSEGPVPPCDFIPLLERSGLIEDVGRWVLRTACAQAAAWSAAGTPVPVTVNVSPLQLRTSTFVDDVALALAAADIEPRLLVLEVTETAAASDPAALTCLAGARALGVRVAVDDFGTGYSSLSHLREMPIDIVKIDRSFVVGLGSDASADAIMKTLLELARSLGLAVTAEGVETEVQAAALRAHGCPTAQGFLFARPAPAERIVLGALAALGALAGA